MGFLLSSELCQSEMSIAEPGWLKPLPLGGTWTSALAPLGCGGGVVLLR